MGIFVTNISRIEDDDKFSNPWHVASVLSLTRLWWTPLSSSEWIVCNPRQQGMGCFQYKFPRHCPPTLPQFLRPVQGPLFHWAWTQGLILKAVTPSNFIQMFPRPQLSLPLMSLPCPEQTLDIFPSACQLAKKISAWCRLFYPLVQTIFCVIKILLSCKTMMWPMKL